ncbi:Chromodomain Y-like protein [Heterocephalus glaber]|uniref:Chromodomain Y-like protein n=1 Tax=Heterocephalus glaber TaxID=10181 RepID=G5B1B8_HETGA|nr:Chromodomain Y-like protein [Heterocephalus glaber]
MVPVINKDHESKDSQLLVASQKFRKNTSPSLSGWKNMDLKKSDIGGPESRGRCQISPLQTGRSAHTLLRSSVPWNTPNQAAADRQVCARPTEVLSHTEDTESPNCRQAAT